MNLKSTLLVSAFAVACGMPAMAQDYSTPFDKMEHSPNNPERQLTSISITSPTYGTQTLNVENKMMVEHHLDFVVNVNQGEKISFSLEHSYAWMHSYFYLDAEKDGFAASAIKDGVPEAGNDAIAYSYYKGYNSAGLSGVTNQNFDDIPDYTVPMTLPVGDYRVRYKIDWDCIDPTFLEDESQNAQGNGNRYIDFMVHVNPASDIVTKIFEFYVDGEKKFEKKEQCPVGSLYPTFDNLAEVASNFYAIKGMPEGKVTDVDNEVIKLEIVPEKLPFTTSTSVDAEDVVWHTMTLNGFYFKYDAENYDQITVDSYTKEIERDENGCVIDEMLWCMVGNIFDGFSLINRASKLPLGSVVPTGDGGDAFPHCVDPEMELEEVVTLYDARKKVKDNKSGEFYFQLHGTNYCINYRKDPDNNTIGWLAYWNSVDWGSEMLVEEVPAAEVGGVNSVVADEVKGDGKAYDILGRQVANPSHGLYIINGKKVFIK